MKTRTVVIWAAVLCAVLLGMASAIITWGHGSAFGVTMAFSVMAMLFNLLAVPFFLWSTKRFSAALQHAYLTLCVGITVFGLAQMQLPLISLFNWEWWIDSGGVAVPYLVGVIGIFWGVRRLSILLSTKNIWISAAWALGATVILSIVAALLPHVHTSEDTFAFDAALALSICNSVFITCAAVAAFKIRAKIGKAYTRSMSWLCAALAMLSFAGWHYAAAQMTITAGNWYYDYSITIVPFIFGALLLVVSGYTFDMIDFLPATVAKTANNSRIELDVVLYVASLISRPADVDVTLDAVRNLTSHLEPGQALSSADRKNLLEVYRQLETYLAQRDPLHVISPGELRRTLRERFGWSPGAEEATAV